jgi:hypothetical protein
MQSKEEVQHFYKNADRHKVEIVYRLLVLDVKPLSQSKFSKHFVSGRNLTSVFPFNCIKCIKYYFDKRHIEKRKHNI